VREVRGHDRLSSYVAEAMLVGQSVDLAQPRAHGAALRPEKLERPHGAAPQLLDLEVQIRRLPAFVYRPMRIGDGSLQHFE
jgi:hypothetical protein